MDFVMRMVGRKV